MSNTDVQKLKFLIERMEKDLKETKKLLSTVELVARKDYREVPGIIGVYDGAYMVTSEGEKHEVPANYSAKSRLVFGDTLKVIEDEGKKLFKQIELVDRKRVEGILNKKDGKWYILSESGSFRLNDAAVDFNKLQLNDKVFALIPANDPSASYAALDMPDTAFVREKVAVKSDAPRAPAERAPVERTPAEKPERPARAPVKSEAAPKPRVRKDTKPAPKSEQEPTDTTGEERVSQLLGDDDLR
jgi:hypothetical protein